MSPPTATTSTTNTLPVVFAHANSFPIGTYRLLFSLLRQAAGSRAVAVHEHETSGFDDCPEALLTATDNYFNHRKLSIFGGSNEVQKNILSKFVLGL